jgi:hypothetical protein
LARQLGGSRDEPRNLVTLHRRAYSPAMRGFEAMLREAVDAGQIVHFQATPMYQGAFPIPIGITLHATGNGGFELHVSVLSIP